MATVLLVLSGVWAFLKGIPAAVYGYAAAFVGGFFFRGCLLLAVVLLAAGPVSAQCRGGCCGGSCGRPMMMAPSCPVMGPGCPCGCASGLPCTCWAPPAKVADPGRCIDSAYAAAVKQSLAENRPLFVYVGQPVAPVKWDMWYMWPVTVSVETFPDAQAPCVVLGKPVPANRYEKAGLVRVADLPGNPGPADVQQAYYRPPTPAAPPVTYYQPAFRPFAGFGGGGCPNGRCGR